jgi:NAD(P)-dependent dehydrogenase (short-subunit alcohol dehydrogenase family)
MSKLAGKVAVVTGASKGIGAGIAVALAAEGAAVVVNYASSQAGADAVVARITQAGGQAVAVKADVSRAEQARQLHIAAEGDAWTARRARGEIGCDECAHAVAGSEWINGIRRRSGTSRW